MKKLLLLQDRKGVSPVIGYVLLIVLAVAMGGAVYYFLQLYIPKEQAQCPEGASLIIKEASCNNTNGKLEVTLVNKGLFTLDGAFIKVGNASETFRTVVNCPGPYKLPPNCSIHFNDPTIPYRSRSLKSGENFTGKYFYENNGGEHEIEIEPLIRVTNRSGDVLCEKAIVTQKVMCS